MCEIGVCVCVIGVCVCDRGVFMEPKNEICKLANDVTVSLKVF